MGPGFVILLVCIALLFDWLFFFLMMIIIQPEYKFHNFTLPDIPMYYQYCPPPPSEYYIRLEYLESLPDDDGIYIPDKPHTPMKN
jgi:hypothetical protein